MSDYDWDLLFSIAKKAIMLYMDRRERYIPKCKSEENKATFVTLERNGELRGCIGSIFPRYCLEEDVARNAVNAAFFDPRFFPLSREEIKDLEITISILSPLRKFEGSEEEWLRFLKEKKPGVFLNSPYGSATFLPEVWKHFKDGKEFLEALSMKASLPRDAWKSMEKYYYFVESKKRRFEDIEV